MEGSKVEIFPSSLTLPGKSEKSQFVLVNIPHETGVVSVLGKEGGRGGERGGREGGGEGGGGRGGERGGRGGEGRCGLLSVVLPGYEAKVFGVHHKCHVKIPGNPIIRVIPKLPLLQARSFPLAAEATHGERRMSKAGLDKFDLLDGERCVLEVCTVCCDACLLVCVCAVVSLCLSWLMLGLWTSMQLQLSSRSIMVS